MAIIDLRDLVEQPFDIVKIKGEKDGKEYNLPTKRTVKTTLYSQRDMAELTKIKNTMSDFDYNLESSYVHICAWIRSYYPEIDIEWVKENIISESLMTKLIGYVMKIFYPDALTDEVKQPETVTPKKPRKKRKS